MPRRLRIGIGDAGNELMLRAMRVHYHEPVGERKCRLGMVCPEFLAYAGTALPR